MSRRRRFTEHEVLETLWYQGVWINCFRCKGPLTPSHSETEGAVVTTFKGVAQREHIHELGLDGPDIPANCRYSHKDCHAIITDGTKATSAGSSKHRIAKANHPNRTEKFVVHKLLGFSYEDADGKRQKWPSRKLKSRGFEKGHRPMRKATDQ